MDGTSDIQYLHSVDIRYFISVKVRSIYRGKSNIYIGRMSSDTVSRYVGKSDISVNWYAIHMKNLHHDASIPILYKKGSI